MRIEFCRAQTSLCARLAKRVHTNQSGSISLISLFGLLILVMLLGMVMNSGQQIDEKVKLQNAVDAATYSGGVVITRSMNTLTFTNHLLSDVFALTAYLREARDQSSNLFPTKILDNWEKMAPLFNNSKFQKFAALGPAITSKVPLEREVVRTYTEWVHAASESFLPVMESILEQRAIPQFQRALVLATPRMAQTAVNEVAYRHGQSWPKPVKLQAVLWRTVGQPVGGSLESERPTLPVVDPVQGQEPNQASYFAEARNTRDQLAYTYLNDWNNETMLVFDNYVKMSQFGNLWRIFTCGQLRRLLEQEYPNDNLPHMLRTFSSQNGTLNMLLERDFQFVGTVYRQQSPNKIPGIFTSPQTCDDIAYAQVSLFVPRQRLIWWNNNINSNPSGQSVPQGGVPGHTIDLPAAPDPTANNGAGDPNDPNWYVSRQDWIRRWSDQDEKYYYGPAFDHYGESWSLWNQNWTAQMVPASTVMIPQILSTRPNLSGFENVLVPDVSTLSQTDMEWLSNH